MRSAQFIGFEKHPDWKTRLEGFLPTTLWDVVSHFQDNVTPVFRIVPHAESGDGIELTLKLSLPIISGEESMVDTFDTLSDRKDFRIFVRCIWDNLLEKLLKQRAKVWEAEMLEEQLVGA